MSEKAPHPKSFHLPYINQKLRTPESGYRYQGTLLYY